MIILHKIQKIILNLQLNLLTNLSLGKTKELINQRTHKRIKNKNKLMLRQKELEIHALKVLAGRGCQYMPEKWDGCDNKYRFKCCTRISSDDHKKAILGTW